MSLSLLAKIFFCGVASNRETFLPFLEKFLSHSLILLIDCRTSDSILSNLAHYHLVKNSTRRTVSPRRLGPSDKATYMALALETCMEAIKCH